jgi:hypothetical protein
VSELEDLNSVPFHIDTTYVVGGGTPHGRYVKVLSVHNTSVYYRLALGDRVVDRGSYA